jgi:hypothetical protein
MAFSVSCDLKVTQERNGRGDDAVDRQEGEPIARGPSPNGCDLFKNQERFDFTYALLLIIYKYFT